MTAIRKRRRPEPVLDLRRIQGIAVPGFFKPSQALIHVRYDRTFDAVRRTRTLLRELMPLVTTGRQALADRADHRAGRAAHARRDPLMAIGFTYPGLCGLAAGATAIRSEAYRAGLAARSSLLGDPVDPATWVVGTPASPLDFMLVIAGDHPGDVDVLARHVMALVADAGLQAQRQDGYKHTHGAQGREHFGFADGVSQPGIRGRATRGRRDFITRSHIAADDWPASALYGYPGQELVWPGEFVLGYPKSGPDPLRPGPIARPDLPWMKNGAYLVYNRIAQDVGEFWRTMRAEAEKLAARPGFAHLGDEVELAAHLVGRYPDGAPVSRVRGRADVPLRDLGRDALANNQFCFESAARAPRLAHGNDPYPPAMPDALGIACPFAAHIRRANPRDSVTDVGGESATCQHRILRVGVPFGPPRADRHAPSDAHEPERGLLFLSIQASIEEQFEFLQARWINDTRRSNAGAGHDLVAGRGGGAAPQCTLRAADGTTATVQATKAFVASTGGAYLFVPSLPALRRVLAANQ
ncbi:MAG: Dyp-type peroxidase [Burkholderiaceae bacterium]